jgi:hypothetical protein
MNATLSLTKVRNGVLFCLGSKLGRFCLVHLLIVMPKVQNFMSPHNFCKCDFYIVKRAVLAP